MGSGLTCDATLCELHSITAFKKLQALRLLLLCLTLWRSPKCTHSQTMQPTFTYKRIKILLRFGGSDDQLRRIRDLTRNRYLQWGWHCSKYQNDQTKCAKEFFLKPARSLNNYLACICALRRLWYLFHQPLQCHRCDLYFTEIRPQTQEVVDFRSRSTNVIGNCTARLAFPIIFVLQPHWKMCAV